MNRILGVVLDSITSRLTSPNSLDGLTQIEADLLAGVTAKGIIDNGGHVYWHEGMDKQQTVRAAEAFDRLDLPDAAAAMRKSLDAFPASVPPRDPGQRQKYISAERARLERDFQGLDETVWETDFDSAAFSYIQLHRDALIAADPALRSVLENSH